MGILSEIYKMIVVQGFSDLGFENGLKGEPPRRIFSREEVKETYEKSYELGKNQALIQSGRRIAEKITKE